MLNLALCVGMTLARQFEKNTFAIFLVRVTPYPKI